MNNTDPIVLIVAPVGGPGDSVRGSIVITADCGHRAMVSPQGQAAMAANAEVTTQCLECAGGMSDAFRREVSTLPGTVDALTEHVNAPPVAVRQALMALIRRHGGTVGELQ